MNNRRRFSQRTLARSLGAVGVFAAFGIPALAVAGPILACPQSIEQKSVKLSDTPPGWTTFVRAPLYLHSAAPMSGPPEELGELAEFSQKRENGAWIYT